MPTWLHTRYIIYYNIVVVISIELTLRNELQAACSIEMDHYHFILLKLLFCRTVGKKETLDFRCAILNKKIIRSPKKIKFPSKRCFQIQRREIPLVNTRPQFDARPLARRCSALRFACKLLRNRYGIPNTLLNCANCLQILGNPNRPLWCLLTNMIKEKGTQALTYSDEQARLLENLPEELLMQLVLRKPKRVPESTKRGMVFQLTGINLNQEKEINLIANVRPNTSEINESMKFIAGE